ncbi:hypothetical protein ACMU_00430 [Actibacterium mucosum KCTC 23349]|uniref:CAAX prenyl protease 2/Lysostaphin resistance protein A-like domain-containing protein n=1 Tax=Actibacterium mucosum KCTC 23349 TaxID=1454373 RepID=A0A037ZQ84_9RHOB|nr:CPBP family intramembrane glutamic endopeptidase [Actibacterium mucosum]KAJ56992.1 hypothetical protein ACMU_00430 [Actibacterium mucosum KCTC 23349]
MHNSNFDSFLAPARAYPQVWRLLLGLVVLMTVTIGVLVILFYAISKFSDPAWIRGVFNGTDQQSPESSLVLLGTFIPMAAAAILAAAVHRRGLRSLLGGWAVTWRDFARAMTMLVPLYAVYMGLGFVMFDAEPNLAPGVWLSLLPLALLLLFIQISAEELVFRGYLMQQLAARFSARVVWMGLPAVGFALLHYDPEAQSLAWGIIAVTFVFALIAADLTERTGNLGAALALHFTNNIVAILLFGIKGSLSGLALYVTPFSISEAGPIMTALVLDTVAMMITWRVLRSRFS